MERSNSNSDDFFDPLPVPTAAKKPSIVSLNSPPQSARAVSPQISIDDGSGSRQSSLFHQSGSSSRSSVQPGATGSPALSVGGNSQKRSGSLPVGGDVALSTVGVPSLLRRNRLLALRSRIGHDFEDAPSPMAIDETSSSNFEQQGRQTMVSTWSCESGFPIGGVAGSESGATDGVSLSSWGRQFLWNEAMRGDKIQVVNAEDSRSTRGGSSIGAQSKEPIQNTILTNQPSAVSASTTVAATGTGGVAQSSLTVQRQKEKAASRDVRSDSGPLLGAAHSGGTLTVGGNQSSSSYSTGSSKSGNLDRFGTPPTSEVASKSNSLDRATGLQGPFHQTSLATARVKTRSLNRELSTSLSTSCDRFLSFDDDAERSRTSEAVELIEEITHELVDGIKKTSTGSVTPTPMSLPPQSSSRLSTVEERASPDRSDSGMSSIDGTRHRSVITGGGFAHRNTNHHSAAAKQQPDIVTTHLVQKRQNLLLKEREFEETLPPTAPPRIKKISNKSRSSSEEEEQKKAEAAAVAKEKLVTNFSTNFVSPPAGSGVTGNSPPYLTPQASVPTPTSSTPTPTTLTLNQQRPFTNADSGGSFDAKNRKPETVEVKSITSPRTPSSVVTSGISASTSIGKMLGRMESIDPVTEMILNRKESQHGDHRHHSRNASKGATSDVAGAAAPCSLSGVSEVMAPSEATSSTADSVDDDTRSVTSQMSAFGQLHNNVRRSVRLAMENTVGRALKGAVKTAVKTGKEVSHKLHGDESSDSELEEISPESHGIVRARKQKKGPFDFDQLRRVQDLSGEHSNAVWCLQFSLCGRLMASAGQDNLIRLWTLKDHHGYFSGMRDKYSQELKKAAGNAPSGSTTTATASADPMQCAYRVAAASVDEYEVPAAGDDSGVDGVSSISSGEMIWAPFAQKPFCVYRGHTADVLDLSWSKNYFLLSSSMDRTVRLWHVSRTECLCVFQHIDFVTAIAFLPKDDRYFLSGSLDGKIRLWHVPDKKVALWNEVEGGRLITALTFVKNAKFVVVGTFDGHCIFYTTEQLKYHTIIDVRSTRGKNAKGSKITGLAVHQDKLLVTSNDSRVRLYDLRDLQLSCKYKGVANQQSQIKAGFSPSGRHIICGSEDRYVYLWRTTLDSLALSVRKDRNSMWERIRTHDVTVTAAVFAPKPETIFRQIEDAKLRVGSPTTTVTPVDEQPPGTSSAALLSRPPPAQQLQRTAVLRSALDRAGAKASTVSGTGRMCGDVLVSADFKGNIYVFVNRTRLKDGRSTFFPTD